MKPLRIIAKLLIILLVFSLISCDENIFNDYADDSSDEAKLEAALIYLDDGEYSKAKAILETLDQNDSEVKRALASAYAGLAGLDVPSLIAALDNTSENSAVEALGKIIGDSDNNNELNGSEISSKLSNINQAIDLYDDLELTDSVKAQLCILYSTKVILRIAEEINNDTTNNVPLNTNISTAGVNFTDGFLDSDLATIQSYISSIDPDLQDGFNEFMSELDGNNDDNVTDIEIKNYLASF